MSEIVFAKPAEPVVPGIIKRTPMFSKSVEDPTRSSSDPVVLDETSSSLERANLITSKVPGTDLHAPVLDLDIPHVYVPSTTQGHGHLYLDMLFSWERYSTLLRDLASAGVIERGYADASLSRGYSAVRPPWVTKGATR